MNRNLIRLAGVIFGVVFGLAAMVTVNGLWGFIVGFVVFFGCAAASDWIWRRNATPEEIRQDLENRARDTST
jgi:membrane protein implicated in regulation of membrane protease activity